VRIISYFFEGEKMQNILIGLFPGIIWGIAPLLLHFIPVNSLKQLSGTTLGICLISLLIFFFKGTKIEIGNFFIFFFSGAAWSIGQYGQYVGYSNLGVSKVFPISTSLQIIGNSLIGGILFNEWSDNSLLIKGLIGIAVILIGVIFSNDRKQSDKNSNNNYYYLVLVFTTIGYWLYSALPKIVTSNNANLSTFLLPQALGMVVAAGILALSFDQGSTTNLSISVCNLIVGCLFGIAAFAYLLSISLNGMVNAFLMSQCNIVIATLLGVYVLKERKGTRKVSLWGGLFLITLGATIIIV
jgi:glucose uptake protein